MRQIISSGVIEQKIFLLRGQKVMLSNHLAQLYRVKTSALIQAVRRNIDRFPEDFMFLLSREEIMNLSQFVISSKLKHAPNVYAFTEQGVAMLSGVLNSNRAIAVNIQIMRAFTQLRRMILTNVDLRHKIEEMEKKYDKQFLIVFKAIKELLEPPPVKEKKIIGFRNHDEDKKD